MKNNILKHLLVVFVVLMAMSCSKDEIVVKPRPIEVTPVTLKGSWQLVEYDSLELSKDVYVYYVFDNDGTYESYSNTNTMYTYHSDGTFDITKDHMLGFILSGRDTKCQKDWNNQYVADLYKEGILFLTVKDGKNKGTATQKFIRVDEVPSDIVEAGKYDKEEEDE